MIKINNPISYDEVKRYNDDLKNKTIEKHKGNINIQSEIDKGSTFTISIKKP